MLRGSADPHFLGDGSAYNPEDMLVAALSACHLLSYLAECARAGIAVVAYEDDARGEMALIDGAVRFREVVLRPKVAIADALAHRGGARRSTKRRTRNASSRTASTSRCAMKRRSPRCSRRDRVHGDGRRDENTSAAMA